MEIKGKCHCFFEQSGTFKNEFKRLGYEALDYDIQNDFGQTDCQVDLFKAIEDSYDGEPSLFDSITEDDLIMAFFPCIYFETIQMTYFQLSCLNNKKKDECGKIIDAIDRLEKRTYFHKLLYKLTFIAYKHKLRLIIENPAKTPNYLIGTQNFINPTLIDKNRMLRGDYFKKPTAYWFINCEPTHGSSIQKDKKQKIIMESKAASKGGFCSEERSMISPDYARNFICDCIIGKWQLISQRSLF